METAFPTPLKFKRSAPEYNPWNPWNPSVQDADLQANSSTIFNNFFVYQWVVWYAIISILPTHGYIFCIFDTLPYRLTFTLQMTFVLNETQEGFLEAVVDCHPVKLTEKNFSISTVVVLITHVEKMCVHMMQVLFLLFKQDSSCRQMIWNWQVVSFRAILLIDNYQLATQANYSRSCYGDINKFLQKAGNQVLSTKHRKFERASSHSVWLVMLQH